MSDYYNVPKVSKINPLKDSIIVKNMNFSERTTSSGIVLVSDDGKNSGIRPRWAEVYAIGPDQKDIKVGQWVLIDHGRWTRGINIVDDTNQKITIRKIDNNDILLISDSPVNDDTMSDKVV